MDENTKTWSNHERARTVAGQLYHYGILPVSVPRYRAVEVVEKALNECPKKDEPLADIISNN